jgi:hypothetical protein
VPNGAADCEAHRVDWRAEVLAMRVDRKDFANREFQLSAEIRAVKTVLNEGGVPHFEGDPNGPQRALTTSERVGVLYKRFRDVENRCLVAERNATVVTSAAAANTRRRLDAEDAVQEAQSKRDVEWALAFVAAVGRDSGLRPPLTPEAVGAFLSPLILVGREQPSAARPTPCCTLDTNGDGDCPIHSAPGVRREYPEPRPMPSPAPVTESIETDPCGCDLTKPGPGIRYDDEGRCTTCGGLAPVVHAERGAAHACWCDKERPCDSEGRCTFCKRLRTKIAPPPDDLVRPRGAGKKDDSDKPRWDLLPESLGAVVDVLTFGARKYAPENWRKVPDARARYLAATMRHVWAWRRGERLDPETGMSHLAHATCCLLFIDALDMATPAK